MKKKVAVPRPSPRFTKKDINKRLFSKMPDPIYIIEDIKEQISCLQSEKLRLDGKNTKIITEKNLLLEKNFEVETELNELCEKTELIIDEIKQQKSEVESLANEVQQSHKRVEEIRKSLLTNQNYEAKLKELRQLQLKKTATVKKLKDSKKLIIKTDFSNLKEALQLYKEDISTLEINNMRIENQISLVSQQIEKSVSISDQEKLRELANSKDTEIQDLLQKIRDAKRKELYNNNLMNSRNSTVSSNLFFPKDSNIVSTPNGDVSRPETSNMDINKVLRMASILYDYTEEFKDMKFQINHINESLDKIIQNGNNSNELIKLKSEVDTIAATIEAEERNANIDAKLEEQCQLELNQLDATLASRKEELDAVQSENEVIQNEIDQLVKIRAKNRKQFDILVKNETIEVQKLFHTIARYSNKYEEDMNKLRTEEEELNIKREKLTDMKSSKEISMFKNLLDKKADIEYEVQRIKTSLRMSNGATEGNEEKILKTKKKMAKLQAKHEKYEASYLADKEELEEMENYANSLMILMNSSTERRKPTE
ncbi:hypothetical protein TRFO_01899 [Tritrichomonas foetus]|uniref:Uncharacterized protein n=1 Tax=Tritrichomonas foetus TaxID=1144522 RepID=A0A1J4JNI9_9EUKA|nr:hypothetical protein TRFO_01899 [Tritrichomonas foetus]|eukprot:OHS98828.1 hypothetical protein TRFO_01899 [Tritrichomonas foetus]